MYITDSRVYAVALFPALFPLEELRSGFHTELYYYVDVIALQRADKFWSR